MQPEQRPLWCSSNNLLLALLLFYDFLCFVGLCVVFLVVFALFLPTDMVGIIRT